MIDEQDPDIIHILNMLRHICQRDSMPVEGLSKFLFGSRIDFPDGDISIKEMKEVLIQRQVVTEVDEHKALKFARLCIEFAKEDDDGNVEFDPDMRDEYDIISGLLTGDFLTDCKIFSDFDRQRATVNIS
jgi:hypothetical protein